MANRTAFGLLGTLGAPRLSILIFHRVLASPDPLLPDEIDAARFGSLLCLIRRSFHVMTLGQALPRLQSDSLPPRSLVITFDDGYANNAEVALPILRRHGLAATFFITSGVLDGGLMWNDTVIEALRATTSPRADFSEFGLGQLPLASVGERRAAIDALLPAIRYMGLAEREDALRRLAVMLRCPELPRHLMMRRDQVRELHRSGMEIGAHTVRHPVLSALPEDEARDEIARGRDELASIIQASVDVMAYPNGRPLRDYGPEHVEMARQLGFRGAVTTAPGAARAGDDLMQLPRFSPWDRSLAAWSARLLWNQWRTPFAVAPTAISPA